MHSLTSATRLVIVALSALATAQQNIADPINNFCRRHQHQTCVIDSKLYIDGGMVYYGGLVTPEVAPQSNTWLIWEDLSDLRSGLPPQYSNLTKDKDVPVVSGGVLWPDQSNKLFYLFGGEYNNAAVKDFTTLWFYDTIYNTWNRSVADGSQTGVSWPSFGASTVDDDGIAYYYGGYLSNKSVFGWGGGPMMLNSLVSYNMETRKWLNLTTDLTRRAEGTLQYIPASHRGMLVYFGGTEISSDGKWNYADMSKILIYDLASNKGYIQTATGQIPQARRGFCAGVAWAEDHSSYNIYIYGGIGKNEIALGDLHVLSIPSFKWLSLYPDPQLTTFTGGKAWASCNVVRQSQMIVMGGYYTNLSRPGCDDPKVGGQHGMLLGQESKEQNALWHGIMPNVSTYRVPHYIVDVVGGGPDGKATVTVPAGGWATSDLSVYFRTTYSAVSRTATRPIPVTTPAVTIGPGGPTTGNRSPDKSGHSNAGAIAGGVIGGLALLIGVVVLTVCCLRRRRKKQTPVQPTATTYPRNPSVEEKSVANASLSQGSTLHPSNQQTPMYSPQGSPIPLSDPRSSVAYYQDSPFQQQFPGTDWIQQGGYAYPAGQMSIHHTNEQIYYPPPPDPSQSPSRHSAHKPSAELPGVSTPANVELPETRSPLPKRGV